MVYFVFAFYYLAETGLAEPPSFACPIDRPQIILSQPRVGIPSCDTEYFFRMLGQLVQQGYCFWF